MDRPGKPITEAGEKAEAFNVLFNSLFMRDIRCEGAGTVPSFDESKESQNGKRVKKYFEELELFVLVKHAGYRRNWQVPLCWQITIIIIFELWR